MDWEMPPLWRDNSVAKEGPLEMKDSQGWNRFYFMLDVQGAFQGYKLINGSIVDLCHVYQLADHLEPIHDNMFTVRCGEAGDGFVDVMFRAESSEERDAWTNAIGELFPENMESEMSPSIDIVSEYGQGELGWTPFHRACRSGTSAAVNDIIDEKQIMELLSAQEYYTGQTPLHLAALNTEHPEVMKLIVNKISDLPKDQLESLLSIQDKRGQTFFHITARRSTEDMAENLLQSLPLPIIKLLLSKRSVEGNRPLHHSTLNNAHPGVVKVLLDFILSLDNAAEKESFLFAENIEGQCFLHTAFLNGTVNMMSNIAETFRKDNRTKELAKEVLGIEDSSGRKPDQLHPQSEDNIDDWVQKRHLMQQLGCYSSDVYCLDSRPLVLIFYTSKDREVIYDKIEKKAVGPEDERSCIEGHFIEKGFYCKVVEDPTADKIFREITQAKMDKKLSGLVVFVMSHGAKGNVFVQGEPRLVSIEKIVAWMSGCVMDGKPKALIVQACQVTLERLNKQPKRADAVVDPQPEPSLVCEEDSLAEVMERGIAQRLDPKPPKEMTTPMPERLIASQNLSLRKKLGKVSLKQPDFLLYMATISNRFALRCVMIPSLVSCLRELGPSDCLSEACQKANNLIQSKLAIIDPKNEVGQVPILYQNLNKKFCIGKDFNWKRGY